MVRLVWNVPCPVMFPGATFCFKLTAIKMAIKDWRKKISVEESPQINEAQKIISDMEVLAESRDLESGEIDNLSSACKKIFDSESIKAS